MTDIERILQALRFGNFIVTRHAATRMIERSATDADIECVGRTAYRTEIQANGCYKVKGEDLVGDDMTVICAFDGDTLIITIY